MHVFEHELVELEYGNHPTHEDDSSERTAEFPGYEPAERHKNPN
jgi:hypothetical protein